MFDPDADLTAIWQCLAGDASILELMGLTGATALERAKHIIKRRQWDDLVQDERRLCIHMRPSRTTRNQIMLEQVVQLDCHVPSKLDYVAYQVQARAKELLHERPVNNRVLRLSGQLGELPSMPGFVCAGSRFSLFHSI